MADLWDLGADPDTLDRLESAWKSQVKQLSWAADTINGAANRVVGGGSWIGETADRYDQHRRTFVKDLDDCAELAGKVAGALAACAEVLRHNQELLNADRAKLSNIRTGGSGDGLMFYPTTAEESQQVEKAKQSANEIRERVNQRLLAEAQVFNSALGELNGWKSRYTHRTLRVMNYNIQQGGGGNNPWPWNRSDGHDPGDFGALADRIIAGDVDVATLQEVFRGGADELQRELDARAAPGEHYEVHFGKASDKYQWSNGGVPGVGGTGDFGNVVVVRTGNGVSTTPQQVFDLGPGDEGRSTTKVGIKVD